MKAALLCAVLLSGCATGEYWHKAHDALPVVNIAAMPDMRFCVGNRDTQGCTIRLAGQCMIFYHADLDGNASLKACVLSHERKHCAGYDHAPGPVSTWICT